MNDCGENVGQSSDVIPRVLKENRYKRVRLIYDGQEPVIEKSFLAFTRERRSRNARYLFEALTWFHREFSQTLTVPAPIRIDADAGAVCMEYLDDLPTASRLNPGTLQRAKEFFEHCYSIRDKRGVLRDVAGSVIVTPSIQKLIDEGFPQALGFKGDLRENLVIGRGLILADIDSIALEPLGLSELVLYAGITSSLSPKSLLRPLARSLPVPVAYQYLLREQACAINAVAVALIEASMAEMSAIIRSCKVYRAQSVLEKLVARHYRGPTPAD